MASVPLGTLLTAISSLAPRVRTPLPSEQTPISGVCYDSRRLKSGDAFVCLRGQARDSHAFAPQALEQGAVLVVGEKDSIGADGPYLQVDDSRKALALLAAAFQHDPSRKLRVVAVTGTNGKTSITFMLDAIFREMRLRSAVLGTLGVGSPGEESDPSNLRTLGFTTPEAPELQEAMAAMVANGVQALAMEVSSHGLELRRTYGTRFEAAIFTNLTPDHLDFHHTMEAYASAKSRLFRATERGPEEMPLVAVVNDADPATPTILEGTSDRVIRFGRSARADVHPRELRLGTRGIEMIVAHEGAETPLHSPLLGDFQVDNLLAAFAAGVALGFEPPAVARALGSLRGIPGRMERIDEGQPFLVVVDYAHTPDALARALESLRPFTRTRVLVVFGCGGERDRAKRPEMGRAAGERADRVFLTDDNPRHEDPTLIRAEVRAGLLAAGAAFVEDGDRSRAIELAFEEAEAGDVVLIAGKGHETHQLRGAEVLPFDDRDVARTRLRELRDKRQGWSSPSYSLEEIARDASGMLVNTTPTAARDARVGYRAISTDTRSVGAGDFFVALRGERFDGHDFLATAAERGVIGALVERSGLPSLPVIQVNDTLAAFQRWGAAHRREWGVAQRRAGGAAPLAALTGSSGKTTTKDLLALLLHRDGPVWATEGNRNNHVGVPWTLLGLAPHHLAAVIELGMNHAGEIAELSRLAAPTVGAITSVGTAHIGHLGSREAILAAKLELIEGLEPDAPLVLPHDPWVLDRLPAQVRARRVITFGFDPEATVRTVGPVEWSLSGTRFTTPLTGLTELSLLGTGALLSALGAIALLVAMGRDPREYAPRLQRARARSLRMEPRRVGETSWLLDCYNASPESTRLALDFHRDVAHRGRRLLVLGELGELGMQSESIHAELGARVGAIDLAIFVGPLARPAYDAATAPRERRWFERTEEVAPWLEPRLEAGDLVCLKGSRRMALERIFGTIAGERPAGGH